MSGVRTSNNAGKPYRENRCDKSAHDIHDVMPLKKHDRRHEEADIDRQADPKKLLVIP